jgi:hypothetical protein
MASQNCAFFRAVQPSLNAKPGIRRHDIRASLGSGHIDFYGPVDDNAVVRSTARQVGRVSTRNQHLRRHAAGVDASAAEQISFDDCDAHPDV